MTTPLEQGVVLERLNERISDTLSTGHSLLQVLTQCCDHLQHSFAGSLATVSLIAESGGLRQVAVSENWSNRRESTEPRNEIGEGLIGQVAQSKKPLFINAASDLFQFTKATSLADENIAAFAGYPLIVDDHLIGAVAIYLHVPLTTEVGNSLRPLMTAIAHFVARKRSDTRLFEREDQLLLALRTGLLGTWRWNVLADRVTWSDQLFDLFGYRHNQFTPTKNGFLQIIHPDDRAYVASRLDALSNGTCLDYEMEFRIIHGDTGKIVWTYGRGTIQRDQQGRPVSVSAIASDISNRKDMEVAIADRELHLRRVIDNMISFVGVLDADGVLLDANMTALTAGGVAREEVVGKKFWDCYWWNFDDEIVSRLKDAVARAGKGEIVRYDTFVRMANDTRTIIDFMLVPVRDHDDRITHLIPSGIDVSERKNAENAALQREQHLNLALEAGRMGSWEWDIVADRITWSDHLHILFGYSKTEFKGTSAGFIEIVVPEDREIVQGVIDSIMNTGSLREEFECRTIRGTDRQTILVQCHGIIERDFRGRPLKINGFAVDITERKRREMNIAFLAELQSALSSVATAEEIAGIAAKRITEYLNLSRCILVDLDENAEMADAFHDYCTDNLPSLVGLYDLSEYLSDDERRRLIEGGSLVINDTHLDITSPKAAARFDAIQIRSIINSAYVGSEQRLEFMISAVKQRAYAWRMDEVELLRELVGNVYLRLERARSDAALRQSEEFNRAIIESNPDCVKVLDLEGRLLTMNSAGLAAFEIPDFESLGGKDWKLLWPEDSRKLVAEALKRALKEGHGSFQTHRPTLAGNEKWWDVRITPVVDSVGGGVRLVAISRDITEQKLWEAELQDRESHLRRVINNQLGLVGVIDRHGNLVEVDDASISIAGLNRVDVIGRHFAECGWWTYDEAVSRKMRESMDRAFAGEIVRYDVPLYAENNQRLMIDFMLAPVKDEEGNVTYLIPSGVDISDRVKAEQAQKDNEERLKMALRAGGMAAWEWNPEESIWTPELYDLLGISSELDASPELFFKHVHLDDIDELKQAWQLATTGKAAYSTEFRIIRPGGDIRWIGGLGEFVRNKAGDVVRVFGVNWDSTGDHIAAEALRESERAAQLANAAKSEFLANMSHEIRTPMTSILGYTDLLGDHVDDKEGIKYLKTIHNNGNFLLGIINDILDLSKIEAGKLQFDRTRFAPDRLIEEVHSIMEVRATENNLTLKVEYDGPIPAEIESDSKRLKQILINLVGNAIKFTKRGSVRIIVRFLPERQPMLQFRIIDTGIGISQANQKRLFKPFAQGDASVTREFGGTGLGLVISRRLANLLGGDISVKSEVDEGSEFTVEIAIGDVSSVAKNHPQVTTRSSRDQADESELPEADIVLDCNVLVVDDRRDVRFLSKRLLTKAGARVDEAEDGQLAVDYIRDRQLNGTLPDLVLLDMQMPNLDGYETARQLRLMGYDRPIIALTADAMQGDMSRCIECGCNDYLSKPIDVTSLLKMVRRLTNNR